MSGTAWTPAESTAPERYIAWKPSRSISLATSAIGAPGIATVCSATSRRRIVAWDMPGDPGGTEE